MAADELVDQRYYQVAKPGSLAERMMVAARANIYHDFVRLTRPTPANTLLHVGVSDVVGEEARACRQFSQTTLAMR